MTPSHTELLYRGLSLDLEVGKEDKLLRALAGVRSDTGQSTSVQVKGGRLAQALSNLDNLAEGAEFVLGHNLIGFDLPILQALNPNLQLLQLPAVDTLRLNPLAFPRNPYHHLVKHYQDGALRRGRINDPELDARLALDLFKDQLSALGDAPSDLLTAWHWLTTTDGARGFDLVFSTLRQSGRPSDDQAHDALAARLEGNACRTYASEVIEDAAQYGWELSYSTAWLSVAGGNSVIPPWVRHQFPNVGQLVHRLRDTACTEAECGRCRERHDSRKELARWFGFSDFRQEPKDEGGLPMQQSVVDAVMAGQHALAILPTGSGKSVCYQIPALSRYDKTGALTVVISPLVALMADQVTGLERRGIGCCATVSGLLSMPERRDALDRVRLGDAGILLVSPEQLRNPALRRAIGQRQIGSWVLDEAHCLSRWGHDFRPDYRYVGRFIREKAGEGEAPPVLCLTATAKPEVVSEIVDYFHKELGIALKVFDGGAQRTNLDLVVVKTTEGEKFSDVHQVLVADLPEHQPGGAIIYCATFGNKFYKRIATGWTLQQQKKAKGTAAQRHAYRESVLRHLIRTIFAWILKEDGKLPPEAFDEAFARREAAGAYHGDILTFLFHERLNKSERERITHPVPAVDKALAETRFLNGSLFARHKDDSLLQLKDEDYFGTNPGQPGLYTILNEYDWTASEHTPQSSDQTIDPEVLSNLFENLIAATKFGEEVPDKMPAGTYYTPSDIALEMVKDALSAAVKEQAPQRWTREDLLQLFGDEDAPAPDFISASERQRLIARIRELTVYDPSVGSGEFPFISTLAIKCALRKLGVAESNAELTRDIISRQIFAQDINPMAVQVTRLRLFVAIIAAESAAPLGAHRLPLPNLEAQRP